MTTIPFDCDRRLDLRGLACPLPVLKTRKALRLLKPGSRLGVATSDPLAAIDIPHFCREAGHLLVETARTEDGCAFLIERGPAPA
jgi:tRNA 2-thiouridine synthesizing protein A